MVKGRKVRSKRERGKGKECSKERNKNESM